jgi:spore coat protein U-like protein
MTLRSNIQSALALTLVAASISTAQADTATSSFQVGMEVSATCSITAADMTFSGITTGTTSQNDADSSLTVNCSNGAPYSVSLSNGENFSGGRRLGGAGSFINYALFKDSSRTAEWSLASPISGIGSGTTQVHTVCGRIPSGQSVPNMGNYADTIVATVSY